MFCNIIFLNCYFYLKELRRKEFLFKESCYPVDDVQEELIIHTAINGEESAPSQTLSNVEIQEKFHATAQEFKRLAYLLEKDPKKCEAFDLGVDSLTKFIE